MDEKELEDCKSVNWTCEHGNTTEKILNRENANEETELETNEKIIECPRCLARTTKNNPIYQPSFWGLYLIFDYLCLYCLGSYYYTMSQDKRELFFNYKKQGKFQRWF